MFGLLLQQHARSNICYSLSGYFPKKIHLINVMKRLLLNILLYANGDAVVIMQCARILALEVNSYQIGEKKMQRRTS